MKIAIQTVWNDAEQKREPRTRDYLYASEVGKSMLDVYYSVLGEPETNPIEQRVKRIFDAGMTIEWLVKRVVSAAGLLLDEEIPVIIPETDDMLSVHGRADMLVGGSVPNIEEMEASEEYAKLPEYLQHKAHAIVNHLAKVKDVEPFIVEIKSVNSMAFWAHKNVDEETGYFKGYDHHKMGQVTTYLIGRNEDSAKLFYVSRDDLCIMETEVFRKDWEEKWTDYVKTITKHIRTKTPPEREPDIVFNERKVSKFYPKGKWEVNWNIGRSSFLTKITGMKKEDWEDFAKKLEKEANAKIKDTKKNRAEQEKNGQNDTALDNEAADEAVSEYDEV